MQWYLLWSDGLLLVLIAMLLGFVWHVLHKPVLREQLKGLFLKPTNFAAIFILVIYVIVGTLDSIHFETVNQSQIVSVLDQLIQSAKNQSEQTYSAPFATHAYSKMTQVTEQGEMVRDYPRLKFGGAHLADPNQRGEDIKGGFIQVLIKSLIFSLFLWVLIGLKAGMKRKISFEDFVVKLFQGTLQFPYKTYFSLIFILFFVLFFVSQFMGQYHILGTSKIGEDVFYQSMKSIRTGLIIGTLTTLIMLPFATLLGIIAGYFLGWLDDIIQYTYTTLSSIPGVLLIAAAVLMLQVTMAKHEGFFQTMSERSDARLLALCAILGITSWTGLCRLLRGETLKIREIDYVQAARSLGLRDFSIIIKHILPNVMHIILIAVALDFSGLVLAEAVLSYVGVGVDPSTYSWGTMINGARLEMARIPMVWWSLVSAFFFMFVLVLSANIFADALRDALDPSMQSKGVA